jgi:uncharacterized membrane protein YidH (DUF202 family)
MRRVDAGIANERTALAWQRTALSLATGAAVLARLTFDRLGVVAVVALAAALALALWVLVESRGRYAHDAAVRLRDRPRGGRAPAALAAATVLVGLTEVAALLR